FFAAVFFAAVFFAAVFFAAVFFAAVFLRRRLPSPPSRRPESDAHHAPRHPQQVEPAHDPRPASRGIVDQLPAVADRVAEVAAFGGVDAEADVGRVVPGGGGA